MRRRIVAGAAVVVAATMLTGCFGSPTSPPEENPQPSYSIVPTTGPSTGEAEPIATSANDGLAYVLQLEAYDAGAWQATSGCGCSAAGAKGELFPAGSVAWGLKVTVTTPAKANSSWWTDSVDASKLKLDLSWGDGAPAPVIAEEGKSRGGDLAPWGFGSITTPDTFPWGETRTFATAVYVPEGATELRLTVTLPNGYKARTGGTTDAVTPLTIKIPDDVKTLVYSTGGY